MTRVWLEFTDADSMGRAAASHVGRIARHVLERGIGVNHNDELALPEEKLKSL